MNSQIFAHLETFDSDEEFEESFNRLHEDEQIIAAAAAAPAAAAACLDVAFVNTTSSLKRWFVRPQSLGESAMKLVCLLPVGIALGDYIGLLTGMNLALFCLILMQFRFEPEGGTSSHSAAGRQISTQPGSGANDQSRDDHYEDEQNQKKRIHECRKEVSRLLGLAGAPPLEWNDNKENDDFEVESAGECREITELSTITIVKFLEAHVQFLLVVDEAFHWLQMSSGLHLGLGAHSQCVERVEQASIAKEYRNRRRRSIGASLIEVGVSSPLVPQARGGVQSSVLSLSRVRRHLAKSMIDQADSLIGVWKSVRESAGTAGQPGVFPHVDALFLPDIVSLAWIRAARQQLAMVVSHLVNHFCTRDVLVSLSAHLSTRAIIDESMWNARNAREYLLCHLLLGKKRITIPHPQPNDKFMLSLLQYRQQLDALSGALWSCQFYAQNTTTTVTKSEVNEDEEAGKQEWWSQIQQLGATCRAIEEEIGQSFFDIQNEEGGDGTIEKDEDQGDESDAIRTGGESGEYEHAQESTPGPLSARTLESTPTKTLVFKGKGAVTDEKQKENNERERNSKASENRTTPLPPVNKVSEQLLVKELRNRITEYRVLDDDESEDDNERDRRESNQGGKTTSHFLGASGSLLHELKLSIPRNDEVGEAEEIIGE